TLGRRVFGLGEIARWFCRKVCQGLLATDAPPSVRRACARICIDRAISLHRSINVASLRAGCFIFQHGKEYPCNKIYFRGKAEKCACSLASPSATTKPATRQIGASRAR